MLSLATAIPCSARCVRSQVENAKRQSGISVLSSETSVEQAHRKAAAELKQRAPLHERVEDRMRHGELRSYDSGASTDFPSSCLVRVES